MLSNFMFHDIRDLNETQYPERYKLRSFMRKSEFLKTLDRIRNNNKVISSYESVNFRSYDGKLFTRFAVLTFDDGLADHHWAYQELKKRGLRGTFLLPARSVAENKVMNSHKIQFILANADHNQLIENILSNCPNITPFTYRDHSRSKFKDNWWTPEMIFVTNFLRTCDGPENDWAYTDYLFNEYVTSDEASFAAELYLNEKQIEEMVNDGMTIGGHGYVSENLLLMKEWGKDIERCSEFVKKYNNEDETLVFSYPNGGYNEQIKDCLVENDFTLAYTTQKMSLTEYDKVDFLELPRYDGAQLPF